MSSTPSKLMPVLMLTVGMLGIQMAMTLDATQFQVMLEKQLPDAFLIGLVLCLGPIAGIVIQPLIGLYGDILSGKGVSRKIMMILALAVALISTFCLSLPLELAPLIMLIAVFFLSFNVLMVTYRALVTQTSSRKSLIGKRGSISGCFALFSGAGSFAMFMICSFAEGTSLPFYLGCGVLLLTSFLFFQFAPPPGKQKREAGEQQGSSLKNASLKNASFDLFQWFNLVFYALPLLSLNKKAEARLCKESYQQPIFRLFLVVFFAWLGIQALRGFFILYADKALHLPHQDGNLMLAVLTIVMVISAIPLGKLADKFDNAKLLRYALLFFSVVTGLAVFWVDDKVSAYVMSVLLGISFAGMVIFPLSLLLKLCPPKYEGVYSGLYNLFLSVPQLYSLLITGKLIDQFHDYGIILPVASITVFIGFLLSFRMTPDFLKTALIPEERPLAGALPE